MQFCGTLLLPFIQNRTSLLPAVLKVTVVFLVRVPISGVELTVGERFLLESRIQPSGSATGDLCETVGAVVLSLGWDD